MRIAPFTVDVTPAPGMPMNLGYTPPLAQVEHPLLAKGVVLEGSDQRCVLCALDWNGVCGEAYDRLRAAVAEAVGTTPDRAAVHSVHQHTAPVMDLDSQRIIDSAQVTGLPAMVDVDQVARMIERIAAAAGEARRRLRPVTHLGAGWAPVDRVASNRRVRQPDGRIVARVSYTADAALRMAPEGLIDGYLRTLRFFDRNEPVCDLHYYATHPQTFYGGGRASYDVPGLAREVIEAELGVPQICFNGCGGNVTMGKYNDGTPEGRAALAARYGDAMRRAAASADRRSLDAMRWRTLSVPLTARRDGEFDPDTAERLLRDGAAPLGTRLKAACILAFHRRAADHTFDLACLSLGDVRVLHLFGEMFVEYQLWAQRCAPHRFVATAAYSDCSMWYVCTDDAYHDHGGYEQTWSFIEPCEQSLKRAIEQLVTEP